MKKEIHKQPLKESRIVNDGVILRGIKFTNAQNDIVVKMLFTVFILGLVVGLIIGLLI